MLTSQARRFGEALIDRHVLSREEMELALEESTKVGESFPTYLARVRDVPPVDEAAAWAAATGARFVDFGHDAVHSDAVNLISAEVMRRHRVVPVKFEDGNLLVAFGAPVQPDQIRAVSEYLEQSGDGHELLVGAAAIGDIEVALADALGEPAVGAGSSQGEPAAELYRLFDRVLEMGASDLHLAANEVPYVRVVGELIRMPEERVLSAAKIRELVYSILTSRQQERFETERELDTSHAMSGKVRFRVNVFVQRNAVGVAFRVIPFEVVDFDLLGIPEAVKKLADLPRGLVLITGPTGSGKSTTLASLVDIVNRTRQCHILTIEDPIEFVHRPKVALVNQREVGEDTKSFGQALTSAMRQDPDVILVGEMRDLETISTAITAAETGHLVFATLHTQDAAQTVDRIIDVFPGDQQGQVRIQLANTLQGVATQQLVPTSDGRSRAVAVEIMLASTAVRALIRDGKIHQIPNALASGKRQGMQTMDDSLADLVRRGVIQPEAAMRRAKNPDDLARLLGHTPASATA
jgi:twitching motility protein PilT